MADVHIRRERCTNLPSLCMRCGAPAVGFVDHTFSTSPGWVILLVCFGFWPYILAEFLFRLFNRLKVDVPVCKGHANHFFNRTAGFYAGVVIVTLVPIISYFCYAKRVDFVTDAWLAAALGVAFCVGLGHIIFFSLVGIKAYDTTNEGLIVCGVAPQFAKAYEESLGAADESPMLERRPKKKKADKDHPFGIREAN